LSDDEVPMGMRISRMEYAVRQTKPLPTCVSRAIQLLTTKPAGGLSAISSICDKGFLVEDHDRRRAGTVRIGESLDKSPGMVALVQLFYDTVTGPDKLAMSAPSVQNYTVFMMAMGELLGVFEKGAKVATDERVLKLPAISDKHMAGICQTLALTADGRLELPVEVATQVMPYVQQLFKQQLIHAGRAGAILEQLFKVEKSKDGFVRIRIQPAVLDGGFPVLERIGEVAYKLELPSQLRVHPVFHVSLLKPYISKGQPGHYQPPPLAFDDEGEPWFEVEAVLEHRDVSRGRRVAREYLIKWKGYDHAHNTWEPERNLNDLALNSYWQSRPRDRKSVV
jgi:hypothetical protein